MCWALGDTKEIKTKSKSLPSRVSWNNGNRHQVISAAWWILWCRCVCMGVMGCRTDVRHGLDGKRRSPQKVPFELNHKWRRGGVEECWRTWAPDSLSGFRFWLSRIMTVEPQACYLMSLRHNFLICKVEIRMIFRIIPRITWINTCKLLRTGPGTQEGLNKC